MFSRCRPLVCATATGVSFGAQHPTARTPPGAPHGSDAPRQRVSSFSNSSFAMASQRMPSSSSSSAFARRARRWAAEPSRASSIKSCRDSPSRKPDRIMPTVESGSRRFTRGGGRGFSESRGITFGSFFQKRTLYLRLSSGPFVVNRLRDGNTTAVYNKRERLSSVTQSLGYFVSGVGQRSAVAVERVQQAGADLLAEAAQVAGEQQGHAQRLDRQGGAVARHGNPVALDHDHRQQA